MRAGQHLNDVTRAKILKLRREGMTWDAIAERLGIWENTARRAAKQALQEAAINGSTERKASLPAA